VHGLSTLREPPLAFALLMTQRIYAQRYDASGAPLGSEFQVKNPPAIFSIMGQRFDSAGNPVGGEFAISEPTQTAAFPDMAMDAAGSFLVAWEGRPVGSFDPAAIHTRLYGSDGNPVQEPIALTSGAACNTISTFINQVNAYISSGKLTAAQGQALISAAQSIQTNLGC
jgi:hypothetical protein